jgi:hypothetical protein
MIQYVFKPKVSARQATSVAAARVLLGDGPIVRLCNESGTAGEIIYAKWGDVSVVATNADVAIPPGAIELFKRPEGATHMSLISATGTPAMNYQVGEGL